MQHKQQPAAHATFSDAEPNLRILIRCKDNLLFIKITLSARNWASTTVFKTLRAVLAPSAMFYRACFASAERLGARPFGAQCSSYMRFGLARGQDGEKSAFQEKTKTSGCQEREKQGQGSRQVEEDSWNHWQERGRCQHGWRGNSNRR